MTPHPRATLLSVARYTPWLPIQAVRRSGGVATGGTEIAMRRTVGLGIVAATVVVLAGVAGAETARGPQPASGPASALGRAVDAVDGAVGGAGDGAVGGAVDRVLGAAAATTGLGETGRIRVGTVERVTRLLTSRPESRTTTLRYPGAQYVKVHFTGRALRPGDRVTVADPAGEEVHHYDARSLADPAGRWAMSVTGDTAVVTVHGGSVEIDRVARGFTPGERDAARDAARRAAARRAAARDGAGPEPAAPGTSGREESVCGGDDKSDAVCYRSADPVAYRRSKAVVRLLINGSQLCTGWRLGPANRIVTNHHCLADSRLSHSTEVWFNYQCAACGGFEVFRPTKVWGGQVLLADRTLDLTVFTVENFAQVAKFGHLELELGRPAAGEEVFIPQHPAGEPTMIAARSDEDRSGTCAVVDPAYNGYAQGSDVSYYCDTEGGSSGSPVLSRRTGRVIALHHFGGCPNSGVRADLIHRRIESLR
jgi:hypothetical protein